MGPWSFLEQGLGADSPPPSVRPVVEFLWQDSGRLGLTLGRRYGVHRPCFPPPRLAGLAWLGSRGLGLTLGRLCDAPRSGLPSLHAVGAVWRGSGSPGSSIGLGFSADPPHSLFPHVSGLVWTDSGSVRVSWTLVEMPLQWTGGRGAAFGPPEPRLPPAHEGTPRASLRNVGTPTN